MADYGIAVGVAHYPDLAADGAADLEGPNNDAQAVYEWLIDRQGGRLDRANVRLVRSADFIPPDPLDPQPAVAKVEQALKWVEQQTRKDPGGRLYLYFSGHGFAPVLEEGALFTAEATQVDPAYVYAHDWLRWFRKAQRFREFVFWMDCCMNNRESIVVNRVRLPAEIRNGIPGPAFVAVAAQSRSALENQMPDGRVHGVFTWTLLEGLRGGAADERGRITGESLKTFLHSSMPEFLPAQVKAAATVDLQPFIRADEGIVFRRLSARPKYPVHLTLPPSATGKELRIWTGRPHRIAVTEVLADAQWTGELVRGLYVAEVPDAGLRQGFAVTGVGQVDLDIQTQGPPVKDFRGSELFRIGVRTENAASKISVIDHNFQRVLTDTGELNERDMPGVYKIRVEIGRDIGTVSEEILLLDRDVVDIKVAAPALRSPSRVPESTFGRGAGAGNIAVPPGSAAGTEELPLTGLKPGMAAVSILSEYPADLSEGGPRAGARHPMHGLELLDQKQNVMAQLVGDCRTDPSGLAAVWEQEIGPGVYFLRLTHESGRALEGSVVACTGWVTELALERSTGPADGFRYGGFTPVDDAFISMRRAGGGKYSADEEAVIEAARLALAQGRNLLEKGHGTSLQRLLLEDYEDPMAAMIGSHLLLMAIDASPGSDPEHQALFDATIARLRASLGPAHPDIAALSLRCSDPALRSATPFTAPPMFSRSWHLITEASYENPGLVPLELWERVHASTSVGPFFTWAADEGTRKAHKRQLAGWMQGHASGTGSGVESARAPARAPGPPGPPAMASFQPAGPPGPPAMASFQAAGPADTAVGAPPEEIREAARKLHIPAAATSLLWEEQPAEAPLE